MNNNEIISSKEQPKTQRLEVNTPELLKEIEELFDKTITPLYGDQASALNKIKNAQDRVTYLFKEGDRNVGVLVVKTIKNNEFEEFDGGNAIEIKTLFVVDPDQNGGKGLGTKLAKFALEVATKAGAENLAVTVSEIKQEALSFFLKKGFEIKREMYGKYLPDTIEYLLIKKIK